MNAIKFKQIKVPKQNGELARLKVVRGPDYGSVFVLMAQRISIGRGEDNDVVVTDLKASRKHAEVRHESRGWAVSDLGSANGIGLGDRSVRESPLRSGDVFSLGETSFEFLTADAATRFLLAPPQDVLKSGGQAVGMKAGVPAQASWMPQFEKSKRMLFIGGGGAILLGIYLLGESPSPQNTQPANNVNPAGRSPGSAISIETLKQYLPQQGSADVRVAINRFFKLGFREYREHNFLRARQAFETVLQIDPSHRLARMYAQNCRISIENEVKERLRRGKKSLETGKLREAKGHYEAVLRLLFRDKMNPAFKEAQDQLTKVEKNMRGEG